MDNGIVVVLLGNIVKRWIKHERLSLTFTRAPMTPSEVSRRYSKGRVFDVVFRKGYRNKGMWASARLNVVGMTKKLRPYHSRTTALSQNAKLHTAEGQEHCKPCSTHAQLNWEARAKDTLKLFLEATPA
jgi:hypothetical protein